METEGTVPFAVELANLLKDRFFQKRLVLWYHFEKHFIPREISEETGIAIQTIRDWINRWKEEGTVEDHEGRGRPIEVTASARKKIVEIQESDRGKTRASVYRETSPPGMKCHIVRH